MAPKDTSRSLTGMRDVMAPETLRNDWLAGLFGEIVARYGFSQIDTPMLEELRVFSRLGEGTDVVSKEMYAFEDKDGTMVALRPESTAGVARAFIQHRPIPPWKVWYRSAHFRHEKPQAGRFRQHHQLGAECFGVDDPDCDVEMIAMLWSFYERIGLSDLTLEMNFIGDASTRANYSIELTRFLNTNKSELHPTDAEKIERHPLRVLDSKKRETIQVLQHAPLLSDVMDERSLEHQHRVVAGLTSLGVPCTHNPLLIRGLDYYTHTVFEVISHSIDASQSTIGGGGRYDGLVAALGGEATGAFGFGSGVERILLALDAEGVSQPHQPQLSVFVVGFGGDQTDVRDVCALLRTNGISTERSYDHRSSRAQMKQANRADARFAVLLGDEERANNTALIRDMVGNGEQVAVPMDELVNELRKRLT